MAAIITEVVDLPTTGVNTERIWLLEHFADWFSVNLGKGSMYHVDSQLSDGVVKHLDERDASQYSADLSKRLRERAKGSCRCAGPTGSVDDALMRLSCQVTEATSVAESRMMTTRKRTVCWRTARRSPIEDKAAEEKAYDDAGVVRRHSNEAGRGGQFCRGREPDAA